MIYKAALVLLLICVAYFTLLPRHHNETFLKSPPFKNFLGVNAFEWDFLQDPQNPVKRSGIYEPKMHIIESFGGIRHYLDWKKIEPVKGKFTFNPTRDGNWNLDTIYQRCKSKGLDVLVCLKTCPDWLLNTYPVKIRDPENVPMPYGADKSKPGSYIEQAKAGFQFAARYGANMVINPALISVDPAPRWSGDLPNQVKSGIGLIKYIECDNERDKWWKGENAHQTAEEYAANLSAFYDGDKGKLGKGVGVKKADPNMKVVMAGLASTDVAYIKGMISWCKLHRGYKKDGSVDLCFDVINFHLYANDHKKNPGDQRTVGIAPELSEAGDVADSFVKLGQKYCLPVWVTEAGYDVNLKSPQRSVSIDEKSVLITQADWTVRTALLYARHGIQKLFFYELYDDQTNNPGQYETSGLVDNALNRRPAANFINQLKNLMGEYSYQKTLSQMPLIDQYSANNKLIYVLMLPSESGKSSIYNFHLNTSRVIIYSLDPESETIIKKFATLKNNNLAITVSETPVFVEVTN